MRAAIVIPTYNERENVSILIERISKVREGLAGKEELYVLFVDDGSPDGTADVVRKAMERDPMIALLERGEKRGLGTAYVEGFRSAMEKFNAEAIVQMDADLQHPPEKVEALLAALAGGADVAIGSRYIEGGSFRGLTGGRLLISRGANWLARTVLNLKVKDATTGFRALGKKSVDIILGTDLYSKGFIFQAEFLFILRKKGAKMVEVPFVFEERVIGASKMNSKEVWGFFRSVMIIRFRRYR